MLAEVKCGRSAKVPSRTGNTWRSRQLEPCNACTRDDLVDPKSGGTRRSDPRLHTGTHDRWSPLTPMQSSLEARPLRRGGLRSFLTVSMILTRKRVLTGNGCGSIRRRRQRTRCRAGSCRGPDPLGIGWGEVRLAGYRCGCRDRSGTAHIELRFEHEIEEYDLTAVYDQASDLGSGSCCSQQGACSAIGLHRASGRRFGCPLVGRGKRRHPSLADRRFSSSESADQSGSSWRSRTTNGGRFIFPG